MKYFPTCGQTVWKSGFVGQHSAVRGRTTVGSPVRRITFSRKGNCIIEQLSFQINEGVILELIETIPQYVSFKLASHNYGCGCNCGTLDLL